MNYAFPLPKCQPHTYEWEDGPHDTCYRCGADRPEAKEDRDALAKEHATASNTEPMNKETDMDNSTDTPTAPSVLSPEAISEPGGEAVRHGSTPSEGVRSSSGVELLGEARRRGLPVAPLTNAAGNIEPPLPTTDAE